jgi:predicted branched-subunit amino acid permease
MANMPWLRIDPRAWAIVAGYVPVAVAFGVTGVAWHLPVWLILGLSLLVYAGASQFAVVPLLAGGAAPVVTILTAWLINLRMAVEAAAFGSRAPWTGERPWSLFWLTDEVFVTGAVTGAPATPGSFRRLALPPYLAWAAGTAAGIWLAQLLPRPLAEALSLSLYGLYLALVVLAWDQDQRSLVAAGTGALVSWAAHLVGLGSWGLVLGSVVGGGAYGVVTAARKDESAT